MNEADISGNSADKSADASAADSIELVLWRHAEAQSPIPGKIADPDRALTPRGHAQATRMAAWLNTRLPGKCRMLVSPAVRTLQTASALKRTWDADERVGLSAGPQSLLTAVDWPRRAGTTIVVGHQPTLGQVAARLLPGLDLDWNIERGAIVWLQHHPERGNAVLRVTMTPDGITEP